MLSRAAPTAAFVLLLSFQESVGQTIRWSGRAPEAIAALTPPEAAHAIRTLAIAGQVRHVVVRFSAPPDRSVRTALQDAGVDLLAYLGDNAFFAAADRDRLLVGKLARIDTLVGASSVRRQAKLHTLLREELLPEFAIVGETRHDADGAPEPLVAVYVLFHRDVKQDESLEIAHRHAAAIRARLQSINALVIELPASRIPTLAEEDAVQWIEPPLPLFSETNNSSRVAAQASEVQDPPYGLDGSGVAVMVFDVGTVKESHADFGGRAVARDFTPWATHSTHVAGTLGGDGSASNGLYMGIAPGVTIESYGFEWDGSNNPNFLYTNPGDLEADYGHAVGVYGVALVNNSMGSNIEFHSFPCEFQGDYGLTSSLVDGLVRGALGKAVATVWSNGNERNSSRCDVEGYGDYYSTSPPACAKNHISVGAVHSNSNSMTAFSSWGPTDDGRLKPDICAPGCQSNDDFGVTSCSSNGGYFFLCGTSMAAPVVTGIGALLLQDYRNQFPDRPDFAPATLKVLLAHNAMDLWQPGPDYQTGYGLVQARDTIDHLRTGNFFEAAVDQGQVHQFLLEVPPGSNELQVTLAWDDVPGTPNVIPSLVNDLDLVAIGPSGTHYPWTLDPLNPSAAAVQTQPDHLNNIEQVRVAGPAAGLWTIQVHGYNVPEGPQAFSVAASPQLVRTQLEMVNGPLETIAPGQPTPVVVRITAQGEQYVAGSGEIVYRVNGGPFGSAPLSPLGGDLHEGELPAVSCGDVLEFYCGAEGSISGQTLSPAGAPAQLEAPLIGTTTMLFADDIEIDRGWEVGAPGDDATTGIWTRVDPNGTISQPEDDHSSDPMSMCFVTGQGAPGGYDGDADVDGGQTTLVSPLIDLSDDPDAVIAYWRWYANDRGAAPNEDVFYVDVSSDGGASWVNVEQVGPSGPGTSGGWWHHEFMVADLVVPTAQVQLRFVAADDGEASVVEAAVDDVTVTRFACNGSAPRPADLNGDGIVNSTDLLVLLTSWGACAGCSADIDGDGAVSTDDLLLLLGDWG